jgi:hypothetical protein
LNRRHFGSPVLQENHLHHPALSLALLAANRMGVDVHGDAAVGLIVAGLVSRLFPGFFVNPVLYEMVAKEGDLPQV